MKYELRGATEHENDLHAALQNFSFSFNIFRVDDDKNSKFLSHGRILSVEYQYVVLLKTVIFTVSDNV